MTRSILLFGKSGQLGQELQSAFQGASSLVALDQREADFSAPQAIREVIEHVQPKLILNAAAYTAVDRAESEPALARAVNASAPGVLAAEALRTDALLVHFSTDYVFDGSKRVAWREEDPTRPLNIYGQTKLEGDISIIQSGCRYLIFRISWLFSPRGHNFMLTILKLAGERDKINIVNDQFGAPTSAFAVARATQNVVDRVMNGAPEQQREWIGLYHMTCAGSTSWHGFANAILNHGESLLGGRHCSLFGITTKEYPTPARRPKYSVLNNTKLKSTFHVSLPPWEDALREELRKL